MYRGRPARGFPVPLVSPVVRFRHEPRGAPGSRGQGEVLAIDRLHVTKTGPVAVTVMVLETLSHEGGPLATKKLTLDLIAEKLTPEEATAPTEK